MRVTIYRRLTRALTFSEALVLICVALMLTLIVSPMLVGEKPQRLIPTMSNLKQLTLGMLMYAADNNDHCPPASEWMDVIYPYVKNESLYIDMTIENRAPDEFGFASFRPLSYVGFNNLAYPAELPYAFQSSDLRWNATGDLSLLPKRPRIKGRNIFSFCDGHVKAMPETWPERPIEIRFKSVDYNGK